MKYLKEYKSLESDSDFEEIRNIMNDISDFEDIVVDLWQADVVATIKDYHIYIYPEKGKHFKINQNIKKTIQKFNYQFRHEYNILYQYIDLYKQGWIKFYVYDDDRGLRDFNTVRMDGSGKFTSPFISRILIKMIKNT
jgi:hypothetical protein